MHATTCLTNPTLFDFSGDANDALSVLASGSLDHRCFKSRTITPLLSP